MFVDLKIVTWFNYELYQYLHNYKSGVIYSLLKILRAHNHIIQHRTPVLKPLVTTLEHLRISKVPQTGHAGIKKRFLKYHAEQD